MPVGTYRWRGLVHEGISSRFEGVVYSPGDPPWVTSEVSSQWYVRASGRGGWLADHAAPSTLFAAEERIFVGAAVAEAGHSMMALDPEGRKVWGTLWLGQAGADAFAVEGGTLYVAGEGGWLGKWLAINRVDLKTYRTVSNPPELQKQRTDICFVKEKQSDFSGIRGLAVVGRWLVLALSDRGRLALFDKGTAAFVREIPLEKPGGLVALDARTVLAVSGVRVVRLDLETGATQVVVGSRLTEPRGLAVDAKGRVLVTDVAAAEQCVKVFAADGRFERRIGRQGGRREGPFNPEAMGNPTGIGVDARGQVWVAENDTLPKRISAWSADGRLIRDFLGPPGYGGGAALDPRVPGRAYFKGMIFDHKPWPEPGHLRAVSFRPEKHPDLPRQTDYMHVPQDPVYRGDRCYLVHDNGWGAAGVFIGELRDDVLRPAVIFGDLSTLRARWKETHPDFIAKLPANNLGTYLWQDHNHDGQATPDEVSIQPGWRIGSEWGIRAHPTLTLCAQAGRELKLLSPTTVQGELLYDASKAASILLPQIKGIASMSVAPDGNVIVNAGGQQVRGDISNKLLCLDRTGRVLWSYPNPFPSNTHASPRPEMGDIQHTLSFEGFAEAGTERVFQLGSNKGSRYLFTTDGLFVAELFRDIRLASGLHSIHQVERGQALQDYNLGDEVFGGWLGSGVDGKVRQILGKEHCGIFEVHGLDRVRRLKGGTIALTKMASAGASVATAVRPIQVLFGGLPRDWKTQHPYALPVDHPQARFALAADDKGLTLGIEVTDASPFLNHGEDPAELCRSGDAVDFRIATRPEGSAQRTTAAEGDMRFVIAMFRDRPVVVRYRYVVPGSKAPREFVSPTGRVTVDAIDVLPETQARVTSERTADGYRLMISLTWAAFDLQARPEASLRGDIGVISSDPDGRRVVAREYYFDKGSREVSDLPSEIRVNPSQWGLLRF